MSKGEVRQAGTKARQSLDTRGRARLSGIVAGRVVRLPEYAKAQTIACYVSTEDEVGTEAVILDALESGKVVAVPRVGRHGALSFHSVGSARELSPGAFGIMEPNEDSPVVSLSETQMVVVPVVAWDESGNRVGRGGGYYDRALREREGSFAVGLAFESQRAAAVPSTQLDAPLDAVVTETRTLRFGRAEHA